MTQNDTSDSQHKSLASSFKSQATNDSVIETWLKAGDSGVEREIRKPMWITMINGIKESSLEGATVLDFGCARGSFLDTLYSMKPFSRGIGVDISRDAIDVAQSRHHDFPSEFILGSASSIADSLVHIAFSYEVIWLLKDLNEHAQTIKRILHPGGVYYAATGCHSAHPRWEHWRQIIDGDSTLPSANHSPEDFVNAFSQNGFSVTARQLNHRDFVPVTEHLDYFPTVLDSIKYYAEQTLVFRFEKRDS